MRSMTRQAATPTLDPARRILARYRPHEPEQQAVLARLLAFLDAHPEDAHRRELAVGHLTAACFVLDAARERALLTHHRKLGRWLQLGGHCDGDADLARVAAKEGLEESGIEGLALEPVPIDLDIHPIPARPSEPEHLHYDVRFVAVAPPGAREVVSDESLALGWFTPEEVRSGRVAVDPSVSRLFRIAFE